MKRGLQKRLKEGAGAVTMDSVVASMGVEGGLGSGPGAADKTKFESDADPFPPSPNTTTTTRTNIKRRLHAVHPGAIYVI